MCPAEVQDPCGFWLSENTCRLWIFDIEKQSASGLCFRSHTPRLLLQLDHFPFSFLSLSFFRSLCPRLKTFGNYFGKSTLLKQWPVCERVSSLIKPFSFSLSFSLTPVCSKKLLNILDF